MIDAPDSWVAGRDAHGCTLTATRVSEDEEILKFP